MVEGELTNGRWAMAAVAGILFTDLFGLGDWWTAGAKPTPIPLTTLVAVEVAVFAFLEGKRYESWKKTGYGGVAGIAPFDPLGMDSPEMREKEVKNGRLAMLAFLGFSSVAAVRGLGPIEALKLHLGNPNVENIYTTKVKRERDFFLRTFFGFFFRVFFFGFFFRVFLSLFSLFFELRKKNTKQVAPEFTLAVFAGSITPMLFEARKTLMDKNKKEPVDAALPVGKA